jgi:hypothetical protein
MIFQKTGLTNNYIFNIDISNIKSYDLNNTFTVTSTTFWNNYTLSDLLLTGYGQTMYDYGLAETYTSVTEYNITDRKLIFKPIGYKDESGNTITLPIINNNDNSGNYFELSGGYLSTFFKLPEYNFELSRYRFARGFTFDSWIYTTNETFSNIQTYNDGFFLYVGTKGENKFNSFFSAETDNSDLIEYDNYDYTIDLEYNAVGLKLNNDRTISLRYLGASGLTTELKTKNTLQTTGWTNIATTFRYCKKINDISPQKINPLIDCIPLRDGIFTIYVNGKVFEEFKNIEEFLWPKKLLTDKDKQIGIPFTINFGGGSFGLKNSYRPSLTAITEFSAVTTGFTFTGDTNIIVDGDNGFFDNNINDISTNVINADLLQSDNHYLSFPYSLLLSGSPDNITISSITEVTGTTIVQLSNEFVDGDNGTFDNDTNGITIPFDNLEISIETSPQMAGNSLRIFPNLNTFTGLTGLNEYNILTFDNVYTLSSNTRYVFSGYIYDQDTYFGNEIFKNIYLDFLDNTSVDYILNDIKIYDENLDRYMWNNIYIDFTIPLSATTQSSSFALKTNNDFLFTSPDLSVFLDEFALIPFQEVDVTGITTVTSFTFSALNDNIIVFDTPIIFNENKKYIFSGNIFDENSFFGNKNISLNFNPPLAEEINIITSITYNNDFNENEWQSLYFEFDVPINFTSSTYNPVIQILNTENINQDYKLYFDNFSIIEYTEIELTGLTTYTVIYEILLNNDVKSIIYDNFGGYFYGGIQQLRLYDYDLSFTDIKKNYNSFATKYLFKKIL